MYKTLKIPSNTYLEVEMKKILILLLVLVASASFAFSEGVKETEGEDIVTVYA